MSDEYTQIALAVAMAVAVGAVTAAVIVAASIYPGERAQARKMRERAEVECALAAHEREIREQIDRDLERVEFSLLRVEDFDKHREAIQGRINGIRQARFVVRGESVA